MNDTEFEVRPELHEFDRYIYDALGVTAVAAPWPGGQTLPHFLRERYEFATVDLLGIRALLLIDSDPAAPSPATIRKHMDVLRTRLDAEPVYMRAQVTAYNRKRLIDQKVPFIVPGNQMYLPMLAIDLREHFRRLRAQAVTFSPSTQAVVIHAILRGTEQALAPVELARRLGYSTMTMTRAFDEVESANVGEVTAHGRERRLRFTGSRREIWTRTLPFLRSPVGKRLLVRRMEGPPADIKAGLTALAHHSMLAAPAHVTYALSRKDWRALHRERGIIEEPAGEPEADLIEAWNYPPALFAERSVVDPLSLYLSLKDDPDERTQASLDEMMRRLGW